jgi:hypothetical protein
MAEDRSETRFVLADVARAHPNRVVWLEPTSDALAHLELRSPPIDARLEHRRPTSVIGPLHS